MAWEDYRCACGKLGTQPSTNSDNLWEWKGTSSNKFLTLRIESSIDSQQDGMKALPGVYADWLW
jgi:hypothetical protein